jgi:hypothetical protein
MTIPGIGALGATALLAAIGNGRNIKKPAIWLRGSVSYCGNTRLAESKSFSASASKETALFSNTGCLTGWQEALIQNCCLKSRCDKGFSCHFGRNIAFDCHTAKPPGVVELPTLSSGPSIGQCCDRITRSGNDIRSSGTNANVNRVFPSGHFFLQADKAGSPCTTRSSSSDSKLNRGD